MPIQTKKPSEASYEGQVARRRKLFRKHMLENWLYHVLSDEWGGSDTMPLGGHEALRYFDDGVEHVVAFEEDAHELGFGYPDEWKMFITRKSFHKIMRWYIWRWVWRDWFGFKRWIWYKLLHRSVERSMGKRK